MIKSFLFWLIRRYKINIIISDIDEQVQYEKKIKYLINRGAVFYKESRVFNLQQDAEKIIIGKDSHIRGTLQVFAYGGKIEIGENTYIGDHTRIWSGENILIGSNVLVSHNVNIIDTSAHEKNHEERAFRSKELLEKGPWLDKGNVITAPILIEDDVWISFNVSILRGVTIGKGSIIGANAVVTKNIPPFSFVVGNPARIFNL